jgi:hypothetical protein
MSNVWDHERKWEIVKVWTNKAMQWQEDGDELIWFYTGVELTWTCAIFCHLYMMTLIPWRLHWKRQQTPKRSDHGREPSRNRHQWDGHVVIGRAWAGACVRTATFRQMCLIYCTIPYHTISTKCSVMHHRDLWTEHLWVYVTHTSQGAVNTLSNESQKEQNLKFFFFFFSLFFIHNCPSLECVWSCSICKVNIIKI